MEKLGETRSKAAYQGLAVSPRMCRSLKHVSVRQRGGYAYGLHKARVPNRFVTKKRSQHHFAARGRPSIFQLCRWMCHTYRAARYDSHEAKKDFPMPSRLERTVLLS